MSSKLSHGSGGIGFRGMRENATEELSVFSSPSYIKLSLDGYNGDRAIPVVCTGETVLAGKLVADSAGEYGTPVYSGISGIVTGIEEKQDIYGELRRFLIIRGNDDHRTVHPEPYSKQLSESNPEELVRFIRKTGIFCLDGYPLWKNVDESRGKAGILLINAVPCEPDDKINQCMILKYGERLLCGIKIILKALSLRHAVIVLTDSMQEQAERLRSLMDSDESCDLFSIVFSADRYPLYENGQIIFSMGGMTLPYGVRPYEIGYAVIDALSCINLFASFSGGLPCTDAVVSIGGDCPRKPHTVITPFGTEISALEEVCGGYWENPLRIIYGGKMKGKLCREDDSIGHGMSLLQFDGQIENREIQSCIRCGKCVHICPAHLAPLYLSKFSMKKNAKKCIGFRIHDCTECGCCSYICPSGIPLIRNIRVGKRLVLEHIKNLGEKKTVV